MVKRKEIRNSTAEFLIFQAEGKEQGIEVFYKDKTVWCTQKAMGLAPSFLTLDMIQSELEQLLDSKVDLVRVRDNMNSLLRQRILRDGIYV